MQVNFQAVMHNILMNTNTFLKIKEQYEYT